MDHAVAALPDFGGRAKSLPHNDLAEWYEWYLFAAPCGENGPELVHQVRRP